MACSCLLKGVQGAIANFKTSREGFFKKAFSLCDTEREKEPLLQQHNHNASCFWVWAPSEPPYLWKYVSLLISRACLAGQNTRDSSIPHVPEKHIHYNINNCRYIMRNNASLSHCICLKIEFFLGFFLINPVVQRTVQYVTATQEHDSDRRESTSIPCLCVTTNILIFHIIEAFLMRKGVFFFAKMVASLSKNSTCLLSNDIQARFIVLPLQE